MRTRREEFLRDKEQLSDEDFLHSIRLSEPFACTIAIAIRRTIARIASIDPEMLSPNDQLDVLCEIFDWGMPRWGWLFGAVDYGQFDDLSFSVLFEKDLSCLTRNSAAESFGADWFEHLPSFGKYGHIHHRSERRPLTFGEWVVASIEVLSRQSSGQSSKRDLSEIWGQSALSH